MGAARAAPERRSRHDRLGRLGRAGGRARGPAPGVDQPAVCAVPVATGRAVPVRSQDGCRSVQPVHRCCRAAACPGRRVGWLVVDGRAGRARRRGGVHRDRAAGPGACRPAGGPRPRLGRPHPQPTSRQDGRPLVARAAAHHPGAAAAPRRRVCHGAGQRPQAAVRPVAAPSRGAFVGLAVVYLHGGVWCGLDKDTGTRPLFRHLAAQGHLTMDVAYRLFPETDLPGMVADAKRAVAWLKHHAADLQIQPDRIVLAGGSAGGHLALLAAYAPEDPALTPAELAGFDPRICGVVSLYGQADLAAHYDHTSQHKTCRPDDPQPDWDAPPPPWVRRLFGPDADRLKLHMVPSGRLDWLVGGTPGELLDRYAQLSPLHRVHPGCPPTLLIHGQHDEMAPVTAMRQLHRRLEQAGVPVTAVYLPHTDHAFDLLVTAWSPQARTAIHVLERFLAVLAATDHRSATQPISGSPAERAAPPQAPSV